MTAGELLFVPDNPDIHSLDTGMYDVAGYGSVYVLDVAEPTIIDTGIGTNREHIFDALDDLDIDEL